MREVPPGRVEGGPTTVSPGSSDTVGRPVRFGRVWAGLWVVKTRGGRTNSIFPAKRQFSLYG
jgi:hypothetical protein